MSGGRVKARMVNQIQRKYRKWPPAITGMIDRYSYDTTVIGPYDHGVLTIENKFVLWRSQG